MLLILMALWVISMLFLAAFVFAFVRPYGATISKRRKKIALACFSLGVVASLLFVAFWVVASD